MDAGFGRYDAALVSEGQARVRALRGMQYLPTHCELCGDELCVNNSGMMLVFGVVVRRCGDCKRAFKAERRRRKLLRVPNCSALEGNPW